MTLVREVKDCEEDVYLRLLCRQPVFFLKQEVSDALGDDKAR